MLFNRDGNGSIELQQITGIFAASNDFSVIASEIAEATRTVASLVGDAVIEEAEKNYNDYGVEDNITAAVRQAVAVLAVSRYTRNTLVSHGDNGSRVVADENEKVPFEWMIDRDERAQRERWFRSMDTLYGLLERTKDESWISSDVRKAYNESIVRTLREFERVYPVDGSYYVYFMLQNLVIENQPTVRRMVGAENWTGMTGQDATELQKELLPLCQRYVIISALITAVRRWNLEVFPLTIARRFAPSYQGGKSTRPATKEEMDAFIAGLEGQLGNIRDEIAEVLADGKNPFANFDPLPTGDPRNKFFSAQ